MAATVGVGDSDADEIGVPLGEGCDGVLSVDVGRQHGPNVCGAPDGALMLTGSDGVSSEEGIWELLGTGGGGAGLCGSSMPRPNASAMVPARIPAVARSQGGTALP